MVKKFWKIKNNFERNRLKKLYKDIKIKKHKIKNKNTIEKRDKITEFKTKYFEFINNAHKLNVNNVKGNTIIRCVPEIFSLKENFDESYKYISDIAVLCDKKVLKRIKYIKIDISNCKKYDLDASCILDSIVDELKYIAKSFKVDFQIKFPSLANEPAYINFISTSFINDKMFHTRDSTPIYKLRQKYTESKKIKFVDFNKNKINDYELIVTQITDMIFNNFDEVDTYRANFGQILGEIMDNIKEHSGNKKPWYIVGNLVPKNEYNKSRIELVIMNYGLTFYENLNGFLTKKEGVKFPIQHKKIIESTNKVMKKQKSFIRNNLYDHDQIYSYLLLQEGFSSKVKSDDNDSKRGSGIIRLLESLEKISDTSDLNKSNMILYTGHTCIKFLNKYRVEKNYELGQEIKVICLNDDKSLFEKLDKKAIISLSKKIPGVIIYLSFDLKEELKYEENN